jgi:predicted transport protein
MEARGNLLAEQALKIWPDLKVDPAAIEKARQADLRALAGKRDVAKVPMSNVARELFAALQPKIRDLDPDILELAENKSVSYHAGEFFLEVLPRKHRLTLLLPLDHSDISDPNGLAQDASKFKFFFYAKYNGGVFLEIGNPADLDLAMPIVRQAYLVAKGAP